MSLIWGSYGSQGVLAGKVKRAFLPGFTGISINSGTMHFVSSKQFALNCQKPLQVGHKSRSCLVVQIVFTSLHQRVHIWSQ